MPSTSSIFDTFSQKRFRQFSSASPSKENTDVVKEFESFDANKDGVISLEEFQAMKKKPTMKQAMEMPRHYHEMSNDVLLLMAARGVAAAQRERLTREVMAVDMIDWDKAQPKVQEIEQAAHDGIMKYEFPFFIGAFTMTVVAIVSIPMVFHLGSAEWFFERYVTGDHPPMKELETTLEVGGWTWNWMEPLLGTLSFLILAAQLTRGLMINVRIYSPWAARITRWQVAQVQARYPRYHADLVDDFVSSLRGH